MSTAENSLKTFVITGANSGIGYAIAKYLLAQPGHRAIITCRSSSKVAATMEELKKSKFGERSEVDGFVMELAELDSVRRCAKEIMEKYDQIDVLINNAAMATKESKDTVDGFEQQVQINLLSHVLFTRLLLPSLAADGRIINVTSGLASYITPLESGVPLTSAEWLDVSSKLAVASMATPGGGGTRLYSFTKRYLNQCTYVMSKKLQESGKSIVAVAVCPGFIPHTNFARSSPWLLRMMMKTVFRLFPFTASIDDGVKNVLAGLDDADIKGKVRESRKGTWQEVGDPEEMCEATWKRCCEALKLSTSLE